MGPLRIAIVHKRFKRPWIQNIFFPLLKNGSILTFYSKYHSMIPYINHYNLKTSHHVSTGQPPWPQLRQVTGSTVGWLGIGFAEGSTVSMTGGTGGGSDAFICSDGEVKRYWNLGRISVAGWFKGWSHRNLWDNGRIYGMYLRDGLWLLYAMMWV